MIVSNYEFGYHDEFGRTHVVTKTEKGYMTTSYDILIQYHRIRQNKTEQIIHKNHPYIGLSYTDNTGKKMTVKEVVQHFGFGDYWTVVAEDDHKSGTAWVLSELGTAVYEKKHITNSLDWERQLKEQVK